MDPNGTAKGAAKIVPNKKVSILIYSTFGLHGKILTLNFLAFLPKESKQYFICSKLPVSVDFLSRHLNIRLIQKEDKGWGFPLLVCFVFFGLVANSNCCNRCCCFGSRPLLLMKYVRGTFSKKRRQMLGIIYVSISV
jgi:hypothetical protein